MLKPSKRGIAMPSIPIVPDGGDATRRTDRLLPLATLAAGLPVMGFGEAWERVRIGGITLNSRAAGPLDLFCALPGQHTHGLRHWPEARRRGAVALMVDDEAVVPPDAVGLRAREPRAVLPELAARLYGHPAARLRLTGVTGTNGKTTTVHMIQHILSRAGLNPAYWSTAWVHGGGPSFRPHMTTPEAPELQRFLAEARDRGATDAVIEVSSHGVVLNRLGGLSFQAGVATNITPDHLDFHGSFDAYRRAKERFIASLGPDAAAVLNAEDPVVSRFGNHTAAHVRRFGWGKGHDAGAVDVATDAVSSRFGLVLRDDGLSRTVHLPVPGRHNILNALAAILVARHYGIPADIAADALADFVPPVRRLEPFVVGPYTVINDVAMNQASYETVLSAMADLNRPLVVINALRGNRGVEVNRDIAHTLGRWNRRLQFQPLIATTSDPQVEALPVDYRVREEERDAFLAAARDAGLAVSCHRDLRSAVAEGVDRLPPGGVLLLLGTFGMDDGPALAAQLLSERVGVPFSGLARPEQREYRE
jgi:UDP-N-acetylmuramoyl-L-alanyl-D-glutamate--2,6-diaminopimelate ligase